MGAQPRIPWIPSFGRTQTRHMTPAQRRRVSELLPRISIVLPEEGGNASLSKIVQWPEPLPSSIYLEIGFGAGEHLLAQAARHSEALCIGCEPFPKGMASMLTQIEAEEVDNIRLWQGDARFVLDILPDTCLDRAFILFPDPWPKKKHHKRRIVSTETLDLLARTMKPGGRLRLATDIDDYASWMLQHTLAHPAFILQAYDINDMSQAPEDWTVTRYQSKAQREGRGTWYLDFIKES